MHDNVNVAPNSLRDSIGFEIFLKMCVNVTKVDQGHLNDCVRNDSVRLINLLNVNAVRKFIHATRDNRKLGQVTLTDSHKVKVIFVS